MVSQDKKYIYFLQASSTARWSYQQWWPMGCKRKCVWLPEGKCPQKEKGACFFIPYFFLFAGIQVWWLEPQQSSLTRRRKLHAEVEGGWAARYKELGSLTTLWHCFTSPDLPTFGIPLGEYDSHENVPHTPTSTGRVLTKRPSSCALKSIPWVVTGSLPISVHSGISFNKTLAHLVPFFLSLCFLEDLN